MPKKPKRRMGKRAYPRVLITLYKGITSAWLYKTSYLIHKVDKEIHDGVAEQEHGINIAKMYLARQEQQASKDQCYEYGPGEISILQLLIVRGLRLDRHEHPFPDEGDIDSNICIARGVPS